MKSARCDLSRYILYTAPSMLKIHPRKEPWCYQKDLLNQLGLVKSTLEKLKDKPAPEIREQIQALLAKNKELRHTIEQSLTAESEAKTNQFLEQEVNVFFRNLSPGLDNGMAPVAQYLDSIDQATGHMNKNRDDFDENFAQK